MSGRHFIILGTASQAPTRHRHHNSYALRWDDQLLLFDPGEGTQRQAILAGVATARLTAVCVSHFHGDHCLGLPGVIQRRALDNRAASGSRVGDPPPLPVFYPVQGQEYFERLHHASVFYDTSAAVGRPLDPGAFVRLNPTTTLTVRSLNHQIPTLGFRLDEDNGLRLDKARLAHLGISGPDVGRLLAEGRFEAPTGTVGLSEVSMPRKGQSFAFVMDTGLCPEAAELAASVDLLVCESTFLDRDRDLAERFRHLTALQAAELAADAGARRLVLSHFSARYPDNQCFAQEAAKVHHDVVAAEELLVVPVPDRA